MAGNVGRWLLLAALSAVTLVVVAIVGQRLTDPIIPAPPFGTEPDQRIVVPTPPVIGDTSHGTVHYHIVTDRPVVILLAGGHGVLDLRNNGLVATGLSGNFLIRSRGRFRHQQNLHVIMLDAPSHQHETPQGLNGERLKPYHADVILNVIADVRKRLPGKKVWLVGTSAGTLSAVNAAARLGGPSAGPDGIVLTSTLTVSSAMPPAKEYEWQSVNNSAPGFGLAAVWVPTFVVWHQDDSCGASPSANAMSVYDGLTGLTFSQKGFQSFSGSGGVTPGPNPCEADAYHGYIGIEDAVVQAIADFILAH